MLMLEERKLITEYGKKLIESGLVKGTGGNLSVCNPEKSMVAISPTGVPYDKMLPEDVAVLDLQGEQLDGDLKPSSEWAFHLGLLNLRADIFAVVHTHSPNATVMACLGWELPAIHYLIGYAGDTVPIAPYATFGTKALSDSICSSIGNNNAVLMANHGMVAVGVTLEKAFVAAEMVEYVSRLYLQARAVGEPVILGGEEMAEVTEKFKTYGQQRKL